MPDKKNIPPCLNLRCKQMYYQNPNQPLSEYEKEMEKINAKWDLTNYWCVCTQTAIGPDNQAVNKGECSKAERKCFQGIQHI